MKVFWRIAKFALVTVYALCGLALVVFLVPATGFEAKSIATGSMRPAIPPGSLVIIHKTPLDQLKVGNVVTYTKSVNPPVTITHRIVKTETKSGAPYFIVKGDANPAPDPAVPGGLIVGKVVFHAPYIGRVALDIRNPVAIAIIVIIPGLLIISDEIIRLRRSLNKAPAKTSGPASPPPAKASSAEKSRQVILSLAALSFVAFGVKTTYSEITTNAVTISKIHLSAGSPSPTPTPSPTTGPCPKGTVMISNTGAGSVNIIKCKNTKTGSIITINITNVTNTNGQSAGSGNSTTTGNNSASGGTSGSGGHSTSPPPPSTNKN